MRVTDLCAGSSFPFFYIHCYSLCLQHLPLIVEAANLHFSHKEYSVAYTFHCHPLLLCRTQITMNWLGMVAE